MTGDAFDGPVISVVIPTYQRAALLERSLGSLIAQTLPHAQFEVVVVDDGSSDRTADVCDRLALQLPLRRLRIANSGISAAKNLGLFASLAPLVLFFDDDDIADPGLLEAHVEAHRAHPDETVAVLGYTTWAPELTVTPLMEYVTEIGQLLFSYKDIADGQLLDHTYFWGGRSSCKRSFLARHGSFDQDFPAIIEDIELGFRLAKHGLKVVHARSAKSYMLRAITYDEFARRCVQRGRGLWLFNARHPDEEVGRYCRIADALERWTSVAPYLNARAARIQELEEQHEHEGGLDQPTLDQLRGLYEWAFAALEARGVAEAAAEAAAPAAVRARHPRQVEICPDPVFVVGSPRSGTSILGWSLAEHSRLWTSGESYVLYFLFGEGDVDRPYDRAMEVPGPRWLRQEKVDREEYLTYLGLGLNALFTNRSRGLRWVDHTPLHTLIMDRLAEVFPGARFLHIVRDGRAVVQSMLGFTRSIHSPAAAGFIDETVPWASEERSACEAWRDHVEAANAFCDAHEERAMVVPYEDLVVAPLDTFCDVHRFLGLADEGGPAEYMTSRQINSSFEGRRERPPVSELWEGWDEERRRTFAEVAGPTMVSCGYWTPEESEAVAAAEHTGD
jgi:glycosyltransferase involved in cell wall biosynthesis